MQVTDDKLTCHLQIDKKMFNEDFESEAPQTYTYKLSLI